MPRAGVTLLLPFLLSPVPTVVPIAAPAATEHPIRVTTDSSAYCVELASRLALQPGSGQDPARRLAEEGKRLCDTGHVRTGIAKLRRALRAAQVTGG